MVLGGLVSLMIELEGHDPQATTPGGRPLARLAPVIWVILFVLASVVFLDILRAGWIGQPTSFADDVGISPRAYAIYRLTLDGFLYLSYAVVGASIFWRMTDKWFGLVITLAVLLLLTRIIPSINFPSPFGRDLKRLTFF